MKSIRSKIITLLLCCVIISTAIIGAVCIAQTSSILQNAARENTMLLCEKHARELNATLDNIETSVDTLATYISENLTASILLDETNTLYDPFITTVKEVGKNHALSLPGVASVYTVFAPKYGNKGFAYTVNKKGVLTASPIVSPADPGDNDMSWWDIPAQLKKATWIDGYSKNLNAEATPVFSYVVPLFDQNELIGVVGMDFSYSSMHSIVTDIQLLETGFAVILDRNNYVISHPSLNEGQSVAPKFQDAAYAQIKDQFKSLQSNAFKMGAYDIEKALGTELLPYTQDGEARMLMLCVLQNGMTLCLTAPQSEIYAAQEEMIHATVAGVIIISVLAILTAMLFANRLVSPIIALRGAARRFTKGDLETAVIPTSKDEVGELAISFEKTRVQMKSYIDELYREAHIDSLTGTHNKTAFTEAKTELNAQITAGQADFALALFDVNYLKIVNDTFGHATGDEMLQKIANSLKNTFGPQNVFRIGGDEFAALLYMTSEEEGAARCAACLAAIGEQSLTNYADIPLSCAAGLAVYDEDLDNSFSGVFTRADRAMYQHKLEIKKKTPFWHKDLKGMRQVQIEHYLEFLNILSQSMDDHLFLFDITANKNWFFNNINEKYLICREGSATNTIEEMLEIVHPADREALKLELQQIADGTLDEHNMNYRWIKRDGTSAWINCHGKVIHNTEGKPFLMIGRVSDTVLLPWYNPLTGLFNKAKLIADYNKGKTPDFSYFALVNIDNLSHLNIKHGQQQGDKALKMVANALSQYFPNNMIYHMEKDHFVILLTIKKEGKIRSYIEKIQQAVEELVGISAAIVPNEPQYHMGIDGLYEHARHLLKSTKTAAGNTISFFTAEDFAHTLSGIDLAEELEDSVSDGSFKNFYLCYQPQIDARTHEVVSCEVLLHYNSPQSGEIAPVTFIPILERTRLIHEVGLWSLESAVKQAVAWREQRPNFGISVNISPIQLKDTLLADTVLGLLSKHGLPPAALTLELTESAELIDTAYMENFAKLRQAGVHISIDDFGTGYANLAYLKKIHADELKIDRLFIKDLKQGSFHYALISSIAAFAKNHGLRLCMEGVETPAELATVELTDPDILQGFLFDRPQTAKDFEARYITPATPQVWSFTDALKQERERVQFTHFDIEDILSKVQIGLWTMQFDKVKQTGKIYCDTITREQLGIEEPLSPSQSFKHVTSHMCEGEFTRVKAMMEAMTKTGDVVQIEFDWMHPIQGKVRMRCTGKLTGEHDNINTFEGFLRTLNNQHDM